MKEHVHCNFEGSHFFTFIITVQSVAHFSVPLRHLIVPDYTSVIACQRHFRVATKDATVELVDNSCNCMVCKTWSLSTSSFYWCSNSKCGVLMMPCLASTYICL